MKGWRGGGGWVWDEGVGLGVGWGCGSGVGWVVWDGGLNIKMWSYQYRIPILKIRRSGDRLIFNMGIAYMGMTSFYWNGAQAAIFCMIAQLLLWASLILSLWKLISYLISVVRMLLTLKVTRDSVTTFRPFWMTSLSPIKLYKSSSSSSLAMKGMHNLKVTRVHADAYHY